MPSAVDELFDVAQVAPGGVVRWGNAVPEKRSGVYVVALTDRTNVVAGCLPAAPIDRRAVAALLEVRPELTLDGARPAIEALATRVAAFWAADETVLYVGRAGVAARPRSLHERISEYYKTPLGARRPHAGGWFLKLLSNLDQLFVHYAPAGDPEAAENEMIRAYGARLSAATRRTLRDPDHPFPFANLEFPKGVKKAHGIRGARGDVRRLPSAARH